MIVRQPSGTHGLPPDRADDIPPDPWTHERRRDVWIALVAFDVVTGVTVLGFAPSPGVFAVGPGPGVLFSIAVGLAVVLLLPTIVAHWFLHRYAQRRGLDGSWVGDAVHWSACEIVFLAGLLVMAVGVPYWRITFGLPAWAALLALISTFPRRPAAPPSS